MRARRFLLVTAALSTIAGAEACKKEGLEPVHGNPKGLSYDPDSGTWSPPPPAPVDAAPPPPADTPRPPDLSIPPGNPKGAHYDAGAKH